MVLILLGYSSFGAVAWIFRGTNTIDSTVRREKTYIALSIVVKVLLNWILSMGALNRDT